jgi:methionyl-tRNA synthetase
MARYYLTVSIPYVNARPHLGYALELVQADALARRWRQAGHEVRFLAGTDDHALKNVLAAEAAGVTTAQFVDANAAAFEGLRQPLRVSLDDFIRTSVDPRHRPGVERLWRASAARGDFYRRTYEGRYCVGCEQFYAETDLADGCCPEHGTAPERVEEENWFFSLSRYQDHVERLLTTGELSVVPETFCNEALAFVRAGLEDISVSRSSTRARGWGIPVPDDPTQVIYVWWDALANYVTALDYETSGDAYRYWWREADERVHVIGKGILRFHAVYWPALLASAGEPAPTKIFVHPYLTAGGHKLSKSAANSVDPVALAQRFGTDAVRWWLLREIPRAADADFTEARLVATANRDLANGIGNLVSRVAAIERRSLPRTVRAPAPDQVGEELLEQASQLLYDIDDRLRAFDFRGALGSLLSVVEATYRLIEATRPWELARSSEAGARLRLDGLLVILANTTRAILTALQPFLPDGADRCGLLLDGRTAARPFERLDAELPQLSAGAGASAIGRERRKEEAVPVRTGAFDPGAVRRTYDAVAEEYTATFGDDLDRLPFDRQFLDEFLARLPGRGPVLEVGCGPGQVAAYLAERGGEVVGIDVAPRMLEIVRRLHREVVVAAADLRELPLRSSSCAGVAAWYALPFLRATSFRRHSPSCGGCWSRTGCLQWRRTWAMGRSSAAMSGSAGASSRLV